MLITTLVETIKMIEIRGSYITLRQVWAHRSKVDGAKINNELVNCISRIYPTLRLIT